MKTVIGVALGLALWAGLPGGVARAEAAEKAVCIVCKVTEGSNTAEAVKAVRVRDDVRYAFCAEKCAKEFDADPAAYLPPKFPRPAPNLAVTSLAGDLLKWETFKGRVVLLDFWATWCAPCRKSMPELEVLHQKYAGRGFSVLGVSIDEDGAEKVRKFIAAKKFTYPIGIDSAAESTWERFHIKAIPAAFLVDQQGQVVAQWTGTPVDIREVEAKLGALLEP